mmetsp:Transcript_77766/g.209605  ORF Transcript_77766/g.209605 Transcript_77766/m.209605 type:complete len:87 (-) Transcript_77766:236-496(-)
MGAQAFLFVVEEKMALVRGIAMAVHWHLSHQPSLHFEMREKEARRQDVKNWILLCQVLPPDQKPSSQECECQKHVTEDEPLLSEEE